MEDSIRDDRSFGTAVVEIRFVKGRDSAALWKEVALLRVVESVGVASRLGRIVDSGDKGGEAGGEVAVEYFDASGGRNQERFVLGEVGGEIVSPFADSAEDGGEVRRGAIDGLLVELRAAFSFSSTLLTTSLNSLSSRSCLNLSSSSLILIAKVSISISLSYSS